MSNQEMHFSEKMDIIMETIAYLRSALKTKKLIHLQVERDSAVFATQRAQKKAEEKGEPKKTGVVKGPARQNWLKLDADAEWYAIRQAIDGELNPSHPVELRIAEFSDGDKAGYFLQQIQKLDAECADLRQKAEEAQVKFFDLERTVLHYQYHESYEMIHLKRLRQEMRNQTKELDGKDKILNAAQLEADLLRSENEKLRKYAGATEVVENARARLIEPKLSHLTHTPDDELLQAYQDLAREARNDFLSLVSKSPRPKDVVFVFHAFNIEVQKFVNTTVPFRHADGNVVFACCLPNSETRRSLFAEVADYMAPSTPRVIIVSGGMLRQTDIDRAAKVVNINQKPGDIAVNDRLRQALGNRLRPYDLVAEGYEDVKIVRGEK